MTEKTKRHKEKVFVNQVNIVHLNNRSGHLHRLMYLFKLKVDSEASRPCEVQYFYFNREALLVSGSCTSGVCFLSN